MDWMKIIKQKFIDSGISPDELRSEVPDHLRLPIHEELQIQDYALRQSQRSANLGLYSELEASRNPTN